MITGEDVQLNCVSVAVPVPIFKEFSYLIPQSLEKPIQVGMRVLVPFRNREVIGYVVALQNLEDVSKIKSVIQVLDDQPVISEVLLNLTRWMGKRYGCSWGEAIENALPKWIKYGKKAERALKKEIKEPEEAYEQKERVLSPEQSKAMEVLLEAFERTETRPLLLFGVTGSGKSELYIRAIKEAHARQKAAICLVPEIALTEQLKCFFVEHFGQGLEILHSKLNDTERFLAWKRLERGEKQVILGPRSALFAPIKNLGLIVIDEEHENSYKQETAPRYHAREVAEQRAKAEGAVLLMGSATPSLEAMYACRKEKYRRIDLLGRIDDRPLPEVRIIDMKSDAQAKQRKMFSIPLVSEIEKNLANKEGTMLLLNRRGFSTSIYDSETGEIQNCPSCEVSLTYHQEEDVLLCHYCAYRQELGTLSKSGDKSLMKFRGFGTEKVESEVARLWPQARVARMDTDSIRRKGSFEKILKDFRDKKIDILVGTQMIAKGFDFPHVTLVGVVLADVGLMLPDFRSSERTFQLLTQVAGRAGRGQMPGRVVIQTYSPQHPSIRYAQDHDYSSFFEQEIPGRYQLGYPPYRELVNFIIRSHNEQHAYLYARDLREHLKKELLGDDPLFNQDQDDIQMIGPAPLPFYRLRGHFRWHLMLKLKDSSKTLPKLWEALGKMKKKNKVAMAVDVNPMNIL